MAHVEIDVHDDGSGTVRVTLDLDPDAVRTVEQHGGAIEEQVRLADLPDAGWSIRWERADSGGARLHLRKEFGRAGDLATVVEQLDGADGPLRDVTLARDVGFFATRFRLAGTADLGAIGTGIVADPELVASLTNERVDVAALDRQLLGQLRDAFRLTVSVALPGDDARSFTVAPGEQTELASESSAPNWRRIGLLVAAGVLVVLAVVVLAVGRHNRRRGTET